MDFTPKVAWSRSRAASAAVTVCDAGGGLVAELESVVAPADGVVVAPDVGAGVEVEAGEVAVDLMSGVVVPEVAAAALGVPGAAALPLGTELCMVPVTEVPCVAAAAVEAE